MRFQDQCGICAELHLAPYAHLTKLLSKWEAHALQCTTAGPYNATLTSLPGVGSVCGLGCGPPPNCRVCKPRTWEDPGSRTYDFRPCFCTQPHLGKELSHSLHVRNTLDAFNICMSSGPRWQTYEASQDKKEQVATGLLRMKLHTQDFA